MGDFEISDDSCPVCRGPMYPDSICACVDCSTNCCPMCKEPFDDERYCQNPECGFNARVAAELAEIPHEQFNKLYEIVHHSQMGGAHAAASASAPRGVGGAHTAAAVSALAAAPLRRPMGDTAAAAVSASASAPRGEGGAHAAAPLRRPVGDAAAAAFAPRGTFVRPEMGGGGGSTPLRRPMGDTAAAAALADAHAATLAELEKALQKIWMLESEAAARGAHVPTSYGGAHVPASYGGGGRVPAHASRGGAHAPYASRREMCSDGHHCSYYNSQELSRKNPEHFEEFAHPRREMPPATSGGAGRGRDPTPRGAASTTGDRGSSTTGGRGSSTTRQLLLADGEEEGGALVDPRAPRAPRSSSKSGSGGGGSGRKMTPFEAATAAHMGAATHHIGTIASQSVTMRKGNESVTTTTNYQKPKSARPLPVGRR